VNKLETGRSDPTVGMLQRLAKALGVPVTALLE
jgi:transcriptional regulator with XRE-family HTH domain